MSKSLSSVIDSPRPTDYCKSGINTNATVAGDSRLTALMKSLYQTDQQVKYLHLQAEVESLLHHQKILKQQRLASHFSDADN